MTVATPSAMTSPARFARWINSDARVKLLNGQCAALLISTTTKAGVVAHEYLVERIYDEDGRCVGYKLWKPREVAGVYETHMLDVTHGSSTPAAWRCTCGDSTYRRCACKHCLGVGAALAKINLLGE